MKLLRLTVSLALLGLLAWRTDWQQVGRACAHVRVGLWLLAVGLYALTQVVSSVRWRMLSKSLGFQRSLRQHIGFYFVGMYFNLFLPTSVGGDVIRAWYLDGGLGRRLAAFLSVFVDRLSGLVILVALACAAVVLCPIALPFWVQGSVWGAALAFTLGLLLLPLLAGWIRRFDRGRRLLDGVRFYLSQPRLLLSTAGLSVVIQASNVILVWFVGQAIEAPVPSSYYWILVPMVTLLTLLPISLNGMGVREGATVLFLAPLGVNEGLALTLAFLWFAVFTVVSLSGGVIYLLDWFPRPKGQLGS